MHRLIPLSLTLATLATMGCIRPDGAKKTLPGKELFAACASCHGDTGVGEATIAAPNIAGLPAWYVESQLVKYRSGIRGAHPEDLEGLRMRPMSRQMMDEGEVKAVAAYVASLTPVKSAPSLKDADAAAGAGAYAVCLACHGDKGQGNQALNAPPLVGQYDWYLVNQLKKFKGGVRGANPLDVTGGQMRPMSMTLADEQAMKNVVAHISTFSR
ncbi:MAG: c-type cytochrome [Myxococcales bacterium]|nr:c-type cytochrome [Myxococcales bacterium]